MSAQGSAPLQWRNLPASTAEAMRYAELQVTTNYSFLRGGSHPGEIVYRAIELGHNAIGITDRNTLAGVVRAWSAIKEYYDEHPVPEKDWIKLLVGTRLETRDGYSLLAYPIDLEGYKRLSRLLTAAIAGRRKANAISPSTILPSMPKACSPSSCRRAGSTIPSFTTSCVGWLGCSATAAISPPICCFAATMPAASPLWTTWRPG